jgi:fumarate reductase iron-sulfur subunit
MGNRITIEVARYNPARDHEPGMDSYEVPLHKEWVVLDALNYIKDHLDGSLTFRWSCRMGVCGSCGMMVNGLPKLTCATFLSDYAPCVSSRCATFPSCEIWWWTRRIS